MCCDKKLEFFSFLLQLAITGRSIVWTSLKGSFCGTVGRNYIWKCDIGRYLCMGKWYDGDLCICVSDLSVWIRYVPMYRSMGPNGSCQNYESEFKVWNKYIQIWHVLKCFVSWLVRDNFFSKKCFFVLTFRTERLGEKSHFRDVNWQKHFTKIPEIFSKFSQLPIWILKLSSNKIFKMYVFSLTTMWPNALAATSALTIGGIELSTRLVG